MQSLRCNGLQATDTASGQWTRLDLNPNALLEEEGAAPAMRFEELKDAPQAVNGQAAKHDASHEVLVLSMRLQHALQQCRRRATMLETQPRDLVQCFTMQERLPMQCCPTAKR